MVPTEIVIFESTNDATLDVKVYTDVMDYLNLQNDINFKELNETRVILGANHKAIWSHS